MSEEWLDSFLRMSLHTISTKQDAMSLSSDCVRNNHGITELDVSAMKTSPQNTVASLKDLCPRMVKPLKRCPLEKTSIMAQIMCHKTTSVLPLECWLIKQTFKLPIVGYSGDVLVSEHVTSKHAINHLRLPPSRSIRKCHDSKVKDMSECIKSIMRRQRFINDDPLCGNTVKQVRQAVNKDDFSLLVDGYTSSIIPSLIKWLEQVKVEASFLS